MQSTFRQRQNYAGKKDGRPETYANPPAHVLLTPPSRLVGKRTVKLPHAGRKPSDIVRALERRARRSSPSANEAYIPIMKKTASHRGKASSEEEGLR